MMAHVSTTNELDILGLSASSMTMTAMPFVHSPQNGNDGIINCFYGNKVSTKLNTIHVE
jgi:hypothetical protein